MTLTIDAIYVNGVLKPLAPLTLAENQQVTLQVMLPDPSPPQPALEATTFKAIWPAESGEIVEATMAKIHAQIQAKVKRLRVTKMPAPESITLSGLWSHVDPDQLEQAFAEVREQTNRHLQRLLDEI